MKLESLDLNLLLVFDALATERSVTQAAAKIGLSQPALSNPLARLRTLFGDPLFERTRGQMRPTPRARQLIAPLSEAIAKLREAFETQAAFRPEASEREFLIATNDYVESLLLPPLVQRLQRDAPSVAVRTVRTDYLFIPPVDGLQSGELDLALGFFGDTPRPYSGLLTKRLLGGRLVSFCARRIRGPTGSSLFGHSPRHRTCASFIPVTSVWAASIRSCAVAGYRGELRLQCRMIWRFPRSWQNQTFSALSPSDWRAGKRGRSG
jgi:DNA-binding transcriptional LysR family regulator